MKKISRRAISVLLIAAAVIFGCVVYVLRYIDDGRSWALAFSSANSGSSGLISDRNGVVLARFGGGTNLYADDEQTRLSCYHALGDYTGATATGVINNFWDNMQGLQPRHGNDQGAKLCDVPEHRQQAEQLRLRGSCRTKRRRTRDELQKRRASVHGVLPVHRPPGG